MGFKNFSQVYENTSLTQNKYIFLTKTSVVQKKNNDDF